MRRAFLTLIFFLLLTSACVGNPRKEFTTSIEAVLETDRFTPAKWIVPAGQTIHLHLTNRSGQDADWTVMARPATPPFDSADEPNIWFSQSLPAGQDLEVDFSAPAAPGQYDVLCMRAFCDRERIRGTLLVVVPEE